MTFEVNRRGVVTRAFVSAVIFLSVQCTLASNFRGRVAASAVGNSKNPNWGSSGEKFPELKKSDAVLENDVAVGEFQKYDDPRKPPGWIHLKHMLTPGLPETPPPPPPQQPPPVSTNNYNAMNPYAGGWMPQIYLRHSGMGNEYSNFAQPSTAQLAMNRVPFHPNAQPYPMANGHFYTLLSLQEKRS